MASLLHFRTPPKLKSEISQLKKKIRDQSYEEERGGERDGGKARILRERRKRKAGDRRERRGEEERIGWGGDVSEVVAGDP